MKAEVLSVARRIEVLIRARYPLVWILSSEERRAMDTIRSIALERSKKVFVWSITRGIEMEDGSCIADLRDPLKLLDYIMELQSNGVFIIKDFHPYLNDPVVIRKLRDLAHVLKTSMKSALFLGPVLKIPAELEKETAVVDFDLPGKAELQAVVNGIVSSMKGQDPAILFDGVSRDKLIDAALGLTVEEAENVFAKSLVQTGRFDVGVVLSEKEQIIRKSGVLEYYRASEEMANIGGLENLKSWLDKRSRAFSEEARVFGLPEPKGILLIGIPGCGKSLTAKAISSMWQLPLLKLDVGKVFSSLVGSSEENVRKAIATAESIAPSILWLDELEKGFSGMGSSGTSDGGTSARVFGTFLTWLQEKTSPVFVVATSNNISQLPPELLRKGRFDEIFYVDLPTKDEREQIFRIHLEKRKRNPNTFELDSLARLTRGFSGSEIEEIVVSALYDAFDQGLDISQTHLEKAASHMIPLSQTMEEEISKIREWAKLRARRASVVNLEDEESRTRTIELQ